LHRFISAAVHIRYCSLGSRLIYHNLAIEKLLLYLNTSTFTRHNASY